MRSVTKMALLVSLLVLCAGAAALAGTGSGSISSAHAAVNAVPTRVCVCQNTGVSGSTLASRRAAPNLSHFDEQVGMTFTQSFTSLEYNVTAVEQDDPTLGSGPAYLLNGLSDAGYWYQVGVSWDWAPGQDPGTGFGMNYEVFSPAGISVFPKNGGGMESFSGAVDQGDTVLLDLYFSNSSQAVVMLAQDVDTGASAEVQFSSAGGSYFVGSPSGVANVQGFFTGLMTEWYHGAPYYANLKGTVYSSTDFALSSAWLWMIEFNSATEQVVFSANTSAPMVLGPSSQLQEFSSNGTTEYANGYELVTGAAPSTVTTTTTHSSSTTTVSATTTTSVSSTAGTSIINVTTTDSAGSTIGGYYIGVWQNGVQLQSCFSPCSFNVSDGQQYQVTASNYAGESFSRWSDSAGTVNAWGGSRTVNVTEVGASTISLTAIYSP